MSPIRTEKNYEIRTLYRKEEIKEFNNKKKGAQNELSQEVDLVEIFELVPSHQKHSSTVSFHGWISSLSEQLNLSVDEITQLVAMFPRHVQQEVASNYFQIPLQTFYQREIPNTKINEKVTNQPDYADLVSLTY